MTKILPLATALSLLATAMVAQSNIDQAVIDECQSAASAAELPSCLKNGSIGHRMLENAAGSDFYGPSVETVIASCRESNTDTNTTWVCVRNAVEKAVETRELIGFDAISDGCVAAISDPDTGARLMTLHQETRRQVWGNENDWNIVNYRTFQGCPTEEVAETSEVDDEAAMIAEAETALADIASANAAAPESADAALCAALTEADQLIADTDASVFTGGMTGEGTNEDLLATSLSEENLEVLQREESQPAVNPVVMWSMVRHHGDALKASLSEGENDPTAMALAWSFMEQMAEGGEARLDAICGR